MLTVKKTKKAISLSFALMLLLIFFCALPITVKALAIPCPPLSASSAVLIDAETGKILCEKNAHERMPMASTTKIMTALVAAEAAPLDRVVTVSAEAVGVEGSSIYLYAGEKMTLRDLLYAMLLESANDAAAAIAIEIGGTIQGFCDMMNQRAKELGLSDTSFKNPHGLYDEEHYTTAHELAKIAAEALRNEEIKRIVSTRKITVTPIEGNVRVLFNHNKMLSLYDGAIGVKTGFTKKSGRCLVSAAERDGLTLIAVTLSAPDDWNDHKKLLDTGFSAFESFPLTKEGKLCYMLPIVGGDATSVPLVYRNTVSATLPVGASERLQCTIECYNRIEFAPVSEGKVLGRAVFYLDGEIVGQTELLAAANVNIAQKQGGLLRWIKNIFKQKQG